MDGSAFRHMDLGGLFRWLLVLSGIGCVAILVLLVLGGVWVYNHVAISILQ